MFLTFANPVLLYGLPALGVPIVVHLLSRRRYEPLDWGAMQFLQLSDETKRRSRLDQFLLLLLRMMLLAVLLFLVSAPTLHGSWFNRFAASSRKDAIIIIDASASMALLEDRQSLYEQARCKAREYVETLGSVDQFQVLLARRDSRNLSLTWGTPWSNIETNMQKEIPYGALDVFSAFQRANELLKNSPASNREIVFITDGQKNTWADASLRERFKSLRETPAYMMPTLRIIDASKVDPDKIRNAGITKVTTRRTLATTHQEMLFEGEIETINLDLASVDVQVLIDQRPSGKAMVERTAPRRAIFKFGHRFAEPGSHVVQFRLPADDYPVDDSFNLAVRIVPSIDVSIIDPKYAGPSSFPPSQFLADSMAPAHDPEPIFRINRFKELLSISRSKDLVTPSKHRTTVLVDPATLSATQSADLLAMVSAGDGLLILPGDNFDPKPWFDNELLRNLLPGKPLAIIGDENQIEKAPHIDPKSLLHPALQIFRDNSELLTAYFPKYWDISTEGVEPSQILAKLGNGKPLFIEKTVGLGKVIISAVPLDNRWRTNLTDLGDYVRLVHEMMLFLSWESNADDNQTAGSRLRLSNRYSTSAHITVTPPTGESVAGKTADVKENLRDANMPGIYSIRADDEPPEYIVLQADRAENELAYAKEEDWKMLSDSMGGNLLRNDQKGTHGSVSMRDYSLRSPLLILLILLLFGEAWFARRQTTA